MGSPEVVRPARSHPNNENVNDVLATNRFDRVEKVKNREILQESECW